MTLRSRSRIDSLQPATLAAGTLPREMIPCSGLARWLSGRRFFLTLISRCATMRPASRRCFEDHRERWKSWAARSGILVKKPQRDACEWVERRFAAFCFQAYERYLHQMTLACLCCGPILSWRSTQRGRITPGTRETLTRRRVCNVDFTRQGQVVQ